MLVLTLCCSAKSFSQSILLDYQEELLNEILLDLNDRYEVEVSVNSKLSNACSITIQASFDTIDSALEALATRCGLEVVKIGNVFSFRTGSIQEEVVEVKKRDYLYQGRAIEYGSEEPLPFAVVSTVDKQLVTDENGRFSFRSSRGKELVKLQSLGYYDSDTTLNEGATLRVVLRPRAKSLEEVVVLGDRGSAPITNIGDKSGYIQLNDVGNNLVPGLSDNLVFNNLRQYPGIMAAGESIADFVIWGSYAGQTHVVYDGISLFNSWGINDDMGRVNPYMIKHVEVYKGGYNVPYGDRVGGVVLIDGKSGNTNNPEANVSLTNQLFSTYLNVPLFQGSSSLQVATRTTLSQSLDLASELDDGLDLIVPKYDYSDLHIKFSTALSQRDQLELSTIFSEDAYKGSLRIRTSQPIFRSIKINSEQRGASLKYSRNWQNGGLSSLVISRSEYTPQLTTNYFINRNAFTPVTDLRTDVWGNPLLEYRTRLTHTLAAKGKHQLQFNVEYVQNEASFMAIEGDTLIDTRLEELNRFSVYGHDQIRWSDKFTMQIGLKADAPSLGSKVYWQPRINGKFEFTPKWNLHFGWGLYNQFISRNSVVDELSNRADVWQVANGSTIPVLKSSHNVLGVGFQGGDFELSLEGFYKTTSGFTRYFVNRRAETIIGEGNAIARGIDLFAKAYLGNHVAWLSYSLSKVEERFGNGVRTTDYFLAPQSQRHELKAAMVFDLNPFELSVTNVYGSGFSNNPFTQDNEDFTDYWRTDLALQYQFEVASQKVEAGVSLLNVFNRNNIRLNQSISVPNGNVINTVGIPFTPTFYLNARIQ